MLLALCCFLGCPLMMGGTMFMMRDREGSKLEREIRRLNAQADCRREAITTAIDRTAEAHPVGWAGGIKPGGLGSVAAVRPRHAHPPDRNSDVAALAR